MRNTNSSGFFHSPIHLLWRTEQHPAARFRIARRPSCAPRKVCLVRNSRNPIMSFWYASTYCSRSCFSLGMLLDLPRRLVLEFVGIVLRLPRKSFRIQRALRDLEVFDELERRQPRTDRQRALSPVPHRKLHAEERLHPPVHLLQFLRIDRQDHAVIRGPQGIAILAVIVARKRATRLPLRPAQDGRRSFILSRRSLGAKVEYRRHHDGQRGYGQRRQNRKARHAPDQNISLRGFHLPSP